MGTFSNNPQGFRTPGGRAGTAVFVEVEGVRELNNRFRQLSRAVVTPREKQKIAQMGAMPIVAAAKKLVKVANKDFPFYSGGQKYTIKRGNLRDSIMYFKQRDGDISIGPRRIKSLASPEIGGGKKTSSGFYASALYGSASQFRTQITEKASQAAIQKALRNMDKAVEKISQKYF